MSDETVWSKVENVLLEMEANKLPPRPVGAFTAKEFAERFMVSRHVAQKRLKKLEQTKKVRSLRFYVKKANNVVQLLDGYQLIEESESARDLPGKGSEDATSNGT